MRTDRQSDDNVPFLVENMGSWLEVHGYFPILENKRTWIREDGVAPFVKDGRAADVTGHFARNVVLACPFLGAEEMKTVVDVLHHPYGSLGGTETW